MSLPADGALQPVAAVAGGPPFTVAGRNSILFDRFFPAAADIRVMTLPGSPFGQ